MTENFQPSTFNLQLPVKELADALGVSTKYVWLMRVAGFPMDWRALPGFGGRLVLTATEQAAREWIEMNEFRLVHCRPVMSAGQLRFGFQLEKWTTNFSVLQRMQSQTA